MKSWIAKHSKLLIIVGVLMATVAAFASYNTPGDYEECLLKHMPDAKSDTSAKLVAYACRQKFPDYIDEKKFIEQ